MVGKLGNSYDGFFFFPFDSSAVNFSSDDANAAKIPDIRCDSHAIFRINNRIPVKFSRC